jgi:hypothetical protein
MDGIDLREADYARVLDPFCRHDAASIHAAP